MEDLKYELANATTHISTGYIAPPWVELAYMDDNVTIMHEELEVRREILEKVQQIPWDDYKLLTKHADLLFNDVRKFIYNFNIRFWVLNAELDYRP